MKNLKNSIATMITAFLMIFSTSINGQSPENRANDFDNLGVLHNELLLEFTKKDLSQNLSIEEVLSEIEKIINSKAKYRNSIDSKSQKMTAKDIRSAMVDVGNNYRNIINGLDMSSAAKSIAQRLVDKTFESNITYKSFLSFVKNEESKVIKSKLSSDEKERILGAASIARYSAFLWNVEMGLSDNSRNFLADIPFKKGRGWIIAGADVVGFLAAGPAGGYYGSGAAYYITEGFE